MDKKLFTIGPVQMYPSTATVRAKGFPHFRTDEFSKVMLDNTAKLKNLLGLNDRGSLIYLACSGTGAMEATVENCVCSDEKVLVINGGGFGKRFCELLAFHGIKYDSVDLKWNEALTEAHLLAYENKGYSSLFVNVHETTTGQLYPLSLLHRFCERNGMMLIVDAISSFLADKFDMGLYGVDLCIISSQKGLCLSPGMAIVAMSERMTEKVMRYSCPKSFYFDYKDYLVNIPRGQTPYTPPVCVIFELQDMLSLIEATGGLEGRLSEVKTKCDYFRTRVRELGFQIPDMPLSNMLTPLDLTGVADAYEVIQLLKNKYGYYVNPCGGELATKVLRVSHIGNTTLEDLEDLVQKIQLCIESANNK